LASQIERDIVKTEPVISSGTSLSGPVLLGGGVIVTLQMPSGWDAAVLTFEGSLDGTNFGPVLDDAGVELQIASSVPASAARVVVNAAILEKLAGLYAFKIRSGTSSVPVNQSAGRTFRVLTKG
jgi:hypothetical protein